MKKLEPYLRSTLRIVAGFLFSFHGFQKILGWYGKSAAFGTQAWIAGMLEMVGGILLILGLFTVPVAFVLSGEMAVAYFQSHSPRGFLPFRNGGELAVMYCFVFLYLCVAGPGPLSLDRLVRRTRS